MIHSRAGSAVIALLLALSVAACGSRNEPATGAAADTAPPAPPANGAPQIVNAADGVHIQYREYGKGEPAIILIHCWSCDSSYWSAQIEPLRAHYTTVTVDLAGHGGSGAQSHGLVDGQFRRGRRCRRTAADQLSASCSSGTRWARRWRSRRRAASATG